MNEYVKKNEFPSVEFSIGHLSNKFVSEFEFWISMDNQVNSETITNATIDATFSYDYKEDDSSSPNDINESSTLILTETNNNTLEGTYYFSNMGVRKIETDFFEKENTQFNIQITYETTSSSEPIVHVGSNVKMVKHSNSSYTTLTDSNATLQQMNGEIVVREIRDDFSHADSLVAGVVTGIVIGSLGIAVLISSSIYYYVTRNKRKERLANKKGKENT